MSSEVMNEAYIWMNESSPQVLRTWETEEQSFTFDLIRYNSYPIEIVLTTFLNSGPKLKKTTT